MKIATLVAGVGVLFSLPGFAKPIGCSSVFLTNGRATNSQELEESSVSVIHRMPQVLIFKGRAATDLVSQSVRRYGHWFHHHQRIRFRSQLGSLNFQIFPNNEATLRINWKTVATFETVAIFRGKRTLKAIVKNNSSDQVFRVEYLPASRTLKIARLRGEPMARLRKWKKLN